jgi:hypothetical protein
MTNELVFNGCDAKLPFLPESEIPTDLDGFVDDITEEEAKKKVEMPSSNASGQPILCQSPTLF